MSQPEGMVPLELLQVALNHRWFREGAALSPTKMEDILAAVLEALLADMPWPPFGGYFGTEGLYCESCHVRFRSGHGPGCPVAAFEALKEKAAG